MNVEAEIKLRPEVLWFAEQMELTLQKNDHKGGWKDCTRTYLVKRLEEEFRELQDISKRFRANIDNENDYNITKMALNNIISESTDVSNFAMMIADDTKRALQRVEKRYEKKALPKAIESPESA